MRSRPLWTYLNTHEGLPNVKFAKLGRSRMELQAAADFDIDGSVELLAHYSILL